MEPPGHSGSQRDQSLGYNARSARVHPLCRQSHARVRRRAVSVQVPQPVDHALHHDHRGHRSANDVNSSRRASRAHLHSLFEWLRLLAAETPERLTMPLARELPAGAYLSRHSPGRYLSAGSNAAVTGLRIQHQSSRRRAIHRDDVHGQGLGRGELHSIHGECLEQSRAHVSARGPANDARGGRHRSHRNQNPGASRFARRCASADASAAQLVAVK